MATVFRSCLFPLLFLFPEEAASAKPTPRAAATSPSAAQPEKSLSLFDCVF